MTGAGTAGTLAAVAGGEDDPSTYLFDLQEEQFYPSVDGAAGGDHARDENAAAENPPTSRPEDAELDRVFQFFDQRRNVFGSCIRQALDEVISSGRTRRWNLDQCNNQEKAYVGVNLENVIRDAFDLKPGIAGMDFDVAGIDVDCKWSRSFGGWQIPKEAVGHICLLVYGDDLSDELAVGLIRIHEEILVGGNRDLKRTIQRPAGLNSARWIHRRGSAELPANFLMSLSKADRDAILAPRGGDERAIQLFRRCEGMVVHRRILELIGQQRDPMRRGRGESRQALLDEGFEVLNGTWKKHRARAAELGGPAIARSDEWLCLRSDGSTSERRERMDVLRRREAAAFREAMRKEIKELRKKRAALSKRLSATTALTLADAVRAAEELERELRDAATRAEQKASEGTLQQPVPAPLSDP